MSATSHDDTLASSESVSKPASQALPVSSDSATEHVATIAVPLESLEHLTAVDISGSHSSDETGSVLEIHPPPGVAVVDNISPSSSGLEATDKRSDEADDRSVSGSSLPLENEAPDGVDSSPGLVTAQEFFVDSQQQNPVITPQNLHNPSEELPPLDLSIVAKEEGPPVNDAVADVVTSSTSSAPKPTSRPASHLRIEVKPLPTASSPQPWDLVDPPEWNGNVPRHEGPYYGSGGRAFPKATEALATSRPLIPRSSYYFGPPPSDSAYGTAPIGKIGIHHPREIIRVERDYTAGEMYIQFAPIYPLELEGRLTPTQFLECINAMNEILISAHSLKYAFFENVLAIFSVQVSRLFVTTHYDRASPCPTNSRFPMLNFLF
ncbi:hypothetical protein FISHEDRAFT_76249 [Fistulina hepatica ATCC 64428]|uniref:Ras modification protein ERF4 n=1 Tax=Fistulina hepatica ATCC 64428 TaxID=1128425 RepID=A0A0D7A4M8_9AGAR|nr:hypothetical protein FISHEDRAFT_76249 [Fistulina hepatica ATCC 64428]